MELDKAKVMAVLEAVGYYRPVPPDLLADTAFMERLVAEGLVSNIPTGQWRIAPLHFVSKQRGHRAKAAYAHWQLTKQTSDKLEAERVRRFLARRGIPIWEFLSFRKEGANFVVEVQRGTYTTEDFQTARITRPDGTEETTTRVPFAKIV